MASDAQMLDFDYKRTSSVGLREEEEAGGQQNGGVVVRASPLSHLTGAGLRLRQIPRDNAPYSTSPRGRSALHYISKQHPQPKLLCSVQANNFAPDKQVCPNQTGSPQIKIPQSLLTA
ncbi:jg5222 [Pararge aegeria aegeria]|uniref:Jg5222 protein n=1 Tax=Pararge aegeria aegeria TaxID=348720 RepID=A0A8S4QK40_9NEOP|nr:jg5222 [Pararge aegeria aegeria]